MLTRVIALAFSVALSATGGAVAQTEGPAELPAADYEGQSYIDSNGCIFLRAGYGGEATWVPRVGQDRKPICGQTPTNDIAKLSDVTGTGAQPAPASRVKTRRVRTAVVRPPVMIGCPVSVPIARRYATTDGGSVVICTAANGSLTGARPPIYPNGSGVGAALSHNRYPGVTIPLAQDKATTPVLQPAVAPAPEVVASTHYVQVGAYGEPANADRAAALLARLGLPVSKGNFSKHGKALQVIYAGPFAAGTDAQMALSAVQSHGFSDAFVR